ncbi:C-type lectin domain family 4 member A-like isoform X2 [Tiliqua scincoides]|uniref:C-type lectin domain family 4 member A-like isoform X2 n=1 Tax=Tiliqua scincoides TaxID=71010 RepID=UPI0034619FBD
MGSEITYAEVNFRNGPSPVQPKASAENKAPPAVLRKLPPWFPWATSGFLLLLTIVLLAVILFLLLGNSDKMYIRPSHNATDWHCLLNRLKGKGLDTADWENSRQNCRGMGFDLVVVNSEVEQDFLRRHAKTLITRDRNYWIGLSDQAGQDKWQWVDDTPLNNSAEFWRKGEPSNPMEKCAVMHISSSTPPRPPERNWNDIKCTERPYHICEAKPVIFY